MGSSLQCESTVYKETIMQDKDKGIFPAREVHNQPMNLEVVGKPNVNIDSYYYMFVHPSHK